MKHLASRRFWRCYRGLPSTVRRSADRAYVLLKADPTHRSLHFKKVGQFWSARVGLHHRALAVGQGHDLVWFWIGSHADYDKLVGRSSADKPRQPSQLARAKFRAPRGK